MSGSTGNLGAVHDLFQRPIFIVSSPRSGSAYLFETLARAPDLFTIGGELAFAQRRGV